MRKDRDTLDDDLTDLEDTDPEQAASQRGRHRTSDLPAATPHPSVRAAPPPDSDPAMQRPAAAFEEDTTTDQPTDRSSQGDRSSQPGETALVRRRNSILLHDHVPPTDDIPSGMANDTQLDGFRELRTRLLSMAAAHDLTHFTTLVVPMTANSGASFVARNLAAAFTLWERRVAILVDCNLLHPTQHLALSVKATDGLFDYLEDPHSQLERLVHATGIPGLHLIPAGRSRSRFREYFSSKAMRSVMGALDHAECYVLLDGPPTKGSPDARILSELADFVVLVVGYGSGTADEVAQTAAMFDPGKFAGVVFNERG